MNHKTSQPVAVITGASSGIGESYARQLASEGFSLLLIARNLEKLQNLAEMLRSQYNVTVDVESVDLADSEQMKLLASKIKALENLEYMINNAGFGLGKRFPDVDIEAESSMIRVHCEATVRLSQAALEAMVPRKKGFLINVASMAAFLTGPGAADYCATKAFINSFSKSIQDDVREFGIRVQSLCPGYVRTGFHAAPTMKDYDISEIPNFLWLKSDRVVRDSLRMIRRRCPRVSFIPSLRYKLAYFLLTCPVIAPTLKFCFNRRLKR